MKCPNCNSAQTFKNGERKGRLCYKCKICGHQFLESYRLWQAFSLLKPLRLQQRQEQRQSLN